MSDRELSGFRAAVITASDKGSRGERVDLSGETLEELLTGVGAVSVSRRIIPDEQQEITAALKHYCDEEELDLIITTGGTGIGPRDVTPEATLAVIDREIPGIPETIRAESLKFTSRAMISRAVCGVRGQTLILNFPGSPKACQESFEIVKPILTHALDLIKGRGGECAR